MNPTTEQIKQAIKEAETRHAIASRKVVALSNLCASDFVELLGLPLGPLFEAMRDEASVEADTLLAQIEALRRMLPGGILLARQVI